ncbi:hypothetical protein KQX54_017140 [Cotesia glomerata]|uniref:Uncharacterized protein n=1 Tax=Cotesia glomerata TaxID=32391 RepID=A0AAV7ITZ4_COTGL|nr:hypothetical protein KQX54_017140 [Cotesia glomerata]
MRSDKGNSTMVMYREEYQREMNKLVNDEETYQKTGRDPTSRLQDLGIKLIRNLVEKEVIDEMEDLLKKLEINQRNVEIFLEM